MKIMLDPGHGGHDSGAIGVGGSLEKDVNLAVALQVAGHLSHFGHRVCLSRTFDCFVELQDRCVKADNWGADCFLSIHANSSTNPSANGFEVWTNPQFDPADVLASVMWQKFRTTFPTMRGRADFSDGDPDQESHFWVLVHTSMPAVLFELGFLSNFNDERLILDPGWQAKASNALSSAITEWELM